MKCPSPLSPKHEESSVSPPAVQEHRIPFSAPIPNMDERRSVPAPTSPIINRYTPYFEFVCTEDYYSERFALSDSEGEDEGSISPCLNIDKGGSDKPRTGCGFDQTKSHEGKTECCPMPPPKSIVLDKLPAIWPESSLDVKDQAKGGKKRKGRPRKAPEPDLRLVIDKDEILPPRTRRSAHGRLVKIINYKE